ncbi:hypothetical protein FOPG_06851 [Fusarium oxysporum f. sp. conglutinans race 2 54008]|uniref:Uncharacterized protein n=2 Tax=Fusarium oxysporum TaxID=5507 RepID=A0A2H3SKW7_FUSOX|nr:hypothetical protein FOPG_06851 [Fusarium oxysporum f. sp. conglutinans race 2 54008]KAG6982750.1 hypothetical protein FocnCong_v007477 [Fusarium oxysporum f. sp. conglutinans]KAI8404032.1 hypothetical protein FOFC_15526 [Fusarium oxysporum]SCO77128.1 uncharacterized protein FRV6_01340 [Fusarium oxysporum]
MPLNVYGHVCLPIDDVEEELGWPKETISKKRSRSRDKPPQTGEEEEDEEEESLEEDVHIRGPQYKLKVHSFKLSQPKKKRGAPDRASGPAPATGPAPSPARTRRTHALPALLLLFHCSLAHPWP